MSENTAYKTLYRAIGLPEWRLIRGEGRKRFPPSMLRHKIFYPSLLFDNACDLARRCHAINPGSEYCGVVIGFDVPPDFLNNYDTLLEESEVTDPLWLTPYDCISINENLQNPLRAVEVYYGSAYDSVKYTALELNDDVILL